MSRFFCLLMFLWFDLSQALNVTFPGSVSGQYESPLLNYALGPQIIGETGIVAEMVVTSFQAVCTLNRTEVEGKIVYIETGVSNIELVTSDKHALGCVERAGAVGFIRGIDNTLVPGMWFRFDQGQDITGNIPVVVVAKKKFDVVLAEAAVSSIVIDLHVDPNRWVEVWDSDIFLWIFRIVLPTINIFGFLLTLRVLHLHTQRLRKNAKNNVASSNGNATAKLMRSAACFELCGFVLRSVYCGIGPCFSTNKISYTSHVFLLNITTPLEVTAMLFAGSLFLRFGGMESITEKAQKRLANRVFVLLSCISFLLTLSLSTMTVIVPRRAIFISVIGLGYTLVLTLTSSTVFLYQGRLFLKRLGSTVQGRSLSDARRASIKKAVKWIMLGGCMQLTQIVVIFIAVSNPSRFLTPNWFVASYCVWYLGLTLAALANTSAFKPIHENTLVTVSRMLKNTISRSGVSISSLRRKNSNTSHKGNSATHPRQTETAVPVVHMVHLTDSGELESGILNNQDEVEICNSESVLLPINSEQHSENDEGAAGTPPAQGTVME